jgi:hypothetical protein
VTPKRWQQLGAVLVGAVIVWFLIIQIEANDAADRRRDLVASIERQYDAEIRAWRTDLREYDRCLDQVTGREAARSVLLEQNGLLAEVLQIIEDANPATNTLSPLFEAIERNRLHIEADYPSFPASYCPSAPPPEPVRPPELS